MITTHEVNNQPTSYLDSDLGLHAVMEQKLTAKELNEVKSVPETPWLPQWLLDNLSNLEPEPNASCPLLIKRIDGASVTNDAEPYPTSIPCSITYDQEGNATVTFHNLDYTQIVEAGKNAILIAKIAGAQTKDGNDIVAVQTHVANNQTDGCTILCPAGISSWFFGGSIEGSGFTDSPSSTSACYNASWANISADVSDAAGKKHSAYITSEQDGDTLLFANTTLSDAGILHLDLGDIEKPASSAQQAFVEGLRQRFGENVIVLFAPNGISIPSELLPYYVEPTPTYVSPPITTETPPAPIAPTMAETAATIVEQQATRSVVGTHLRGTLECGPTSCFSIYAITNLDAPKVQQLLQLYASGGILSEKLAAENINDVIDLKNDHKFINFLRALFGKDPLLTDVVELDNSSAHFELSEIIYAHQTESDSTFITRTHTPEGPDKYYIVRGDNRDLASLTLSLTDANANVDPQGTQVVQNIQADIPIADKVASQEDANQDLIITDPGAVSGLNTGGNIALIASTYSSNTTPAFEYSSTLTGLDLEPTLVPLGISGQYGGSIYLDPASNELYVRIKINHISHPGHGDFILVPIGNIDTSIN